MTDTAQDRNQPATPKRRREFSERGETGMSREVATALLTLTAAGCVAVMGAGAGTRIGSLVRDSLGGLGSVSALGRLSQAAGECAGILAPFFVILILVALLAFIVQGGVVFSFKVLRPKLERINPLKRFRQVFFSRRALTELLKGLLKVAMLGGLTTWFVVEHLPGIIELNRAGPDSLARFFATTSVWITGFGALGLAGLAVFDKAYLRWDLEKRMKMTRQEVREEHKQHEGDPIIKSRRRQRHREMSLNRVLSEVPRADVVVANPSHFAVALRYDRVADSSPRVSAKGKDRLALRIRSIARLSGIPIVENKALARSLYRSVRVGQAVKPELYKTVAEVYAFLFSRREVVES